MKTLARLLPALLILLTACAPQITHHPRPELSVDTAPFAALGCVDDGYGNLNCPPGSPPAELGCSWLRQPDPLLGGLQPAHPLIVCIYSPVDGYRSEFPGVDGYFYSAGGLLPQFVRYLIVQDGQLRLLKGPPDLRAVYAPVESPEEALSFALASGPFEAYYDLEFEPGLKYEVDTLEDTFVETVDGGYLVHVFFYQVFGCGPHYTEAMTIRVSTYGQVETVDRQNLFRDPDQDGLCVD